MMVRQQGLVGIAALVGALAAVGCGDPCLDDGFGGGECPLAATSSGAGSSAGSGPLEGTTSQGSSSVSHGVTSLAETGSDGTATTDSGPLITGTTNDTTLTDTTTDGTGTTSPPDDDTSGLELFCLDADGDGFPDLEDCVEADPGDPPPDHIPPGAIDDCEDTNPDVFPGAAFNEPALCTIDADGDGWGSTTPPPGADAGSDCDDGSPFTFPGAAQLEQPPLDGQCLRDEDDDGWGDDTPPPGVVAGQDCVDDDPTIAPAAAIHEPALCTVDADGDGWGDWNAPSLDPAADEGSDCDDADPLVERCALLVTQDGTASANLDVPLVPALQALGLTVLLGEDSVVTPASADPAVLVVVSASSTSFQVGATFRDVDEGVVVLEGLIWDDMEMSNSANNSNDDDVTILDDAHPLAAGLSGTVGFMTPGPAGVFRTSPGPGADRIAARVGNSNHIVVFAFDQGVVMRNAFVAPGRRVGFGTDIGGGGGAQNGQLAATGLALFSAAASWAIE